MDEARIRRGRSDRLNRVAAEALEVDGAVVMLEFVVQWALTCGPVRFKIVSAAGGATPMKLASNARRASCPLHRSAAEMHTVGANSPPT